MELSKLGANAGATVASMALCLPTAGVGGSTGNSGVVGETETILGPRIDINTHHNGLQGNNCGSEENRGSVNFNRDLYPSRQNSTLGVSRSLTSNNNSEINEDAVSGITSNQEVNCSVSVTVQSSTTLKTNCQQRNGNNDITANMDAELYASDEINPDSSSINGTSFLPSMAGITKMSSNDNLTSFCSLLSASVPAMSVNGHGDINNDDTDFDGIDLGNDDDNDSCVPLGEILEKLQAEEAVGGDLYCRNSSSEEFSSTVGPASTLNNNNENSESAMIGKISLEDETLENCSSDKGINEDHDGNNLIRLHAVNDTFHDGDSPTISATVNVATLDLSDPESIHQHLSQLNDTVLRVSAEPFSIRSPSPLFLSNAINPSSTSETMLDSSASCSSSNHDVSPLTPVENNTSSTSIVSGSPSSCSNTPVSKNMYIENANTSMDTNAFHDAHLPSIQSEKRFEPINVDIKSETKDGLGVEDMYGDTNALMPTTTNLIKSPRQSTSTVVGNLVSSLMSPSSQQSPGGSTCSTSTCSSNQVPLIPSPFLTPSTTIALPTSPVPVSLSLPSSPCPLGPASLSHSTINSNSNLNLVQSISSTSPVPPPSPSTQTGTPGTTPTNSPMLSRRSSSGTKSGSSGSQAACAVCFKTFSNASALAKHRLTHSEERRYHCTICSKAFKRQDHLNGHLLTHRSTKPFACQVDGCGKSYCDARSLRRHKENHHNNKNKKEGQQDAGTSNNSGAVPTVTTKTIPRLNSQAPNINSPILTINTDKPNIKNFPSATATNNTNPPEHLITACKSVLGGDTKVKFSSKGLTPQQLQIIQKIFKETKSDVLNNSTPDIVQTKNICTSSSFVSTKVGDSISSVSLVAAKALAAVQSPPKGPVSNSTISTNTFQRQKSLDKGPTSSSVPSSGNGTESGKPVECGICSRKFKNVPALNGHMRLHGGYYKKDEHGKRITSLSENNRRNKSGSMTNMHGKSNSNRIEKASVPSSIGSKRKISNQNQSSNSLTSNAPNSIGNMTCSGGLSVFPAVGLTTNNLHQNKTNQGSTGSSLSISPLNTNSQPGGLLVQPNQSLNNGEHSNSSVVLTSTSIEPPTKKPSFSDSSLGGVLRHPSSEPPSPSLAFCSLPPPDTNRLLANLELKAAQQQQQLLAIPNAIKTVASSTFSPSSNVETDVVGAIARNTSVISSNPNNNPKILKAAGFVHSSVPDASSKSLQITPSILTSKSTPLSNISIPEIPLQPSGLEISPVRLKSNVCPRSITDSPRIQIGNCSPAVSLPTMPLPVSSVENRSPLTMRLPASIASLMSSSSLPFPTILTSKRSISNIEKTTLEEGSIQNDLISSHGQSALRQSHFLTSSQTNMNFSPTHNRIVTSEDDPNYTKIVDYSDSIVASSNLSGNAEDINLGCQMMKELTIPSTQKPCNMLKVDSSTDKEPKIGSDHQVDIPSMVKREIKDEVSGNDLKSNTSTETQFDERMRWNPDLAIHVSDEEMCQYLMLASSCMVSGGSHNEELALELLHKHSGDIRSATKDLLSPHYDSNITQDTSSRPWTESEVDLFYEGLVKHHKNFHKISSDIKSKSTKECVEFYYLWKNVCQEEAQSFKNIFQVGESFTEVKSLPVQDF